MTINNIKKPVYQRDVQNFVITGFDALSAYLRDRDVWLNYVQCEFCAGNYVHYINIVGTLKDTFFSFTVKQCLFLIKILIKFAELEMVREYCFIKISFTFHQLFVNPKLCLAENFLNWSLIYKLNPKRFEYRCVLKCLLKSRADHYCCCIKHSSYI